MLLEGKVAIVTGAARGTGRRIRSIARQPIEGARPLEGNLQVHATGDHGRAGVGRGGQLPEL